MMVWQWTIPQNEPQTHHDLIFTNATIRHEMVQNASPATAASKRTPHSRFRDSFSIDSSSYSFTFISSVKTEPRATILSNVPPPSRSTGKRLHGVHIASLLPLLLDEFNLSYFSHSPRHLRHRSTARAPGASPAARDWVAPGARCYPCMRPWSSHAPLHRPEC